MPSRGIMSGHAIETRFHHVGFVVPSIETSIHRFAASIGASHQSAIVEDPIQRVRVVFLSLSKLNNPSLELIEPVCDHSPVMRFLRSGDGGLHHVCYEVPDLTGTLEYVCSTGATLLRRPRPAVVFENRQIAWVMTVDKLLIEYLEIGSR